MEDIKLILFSDNNILLNNSNNFVSLHEISEFNIPQLSEYVIKKYKSENLLNIKPYTKYYTADLPTEITNALSESDYKNCFKTLRSVMLNPVIAQDNKKIQLIIKAKQLLHWERDHKFCGRCGSLTCFSEKEHAKECANCGLISYPRISPCILIAVIKDQSILLGRSAHFPAGVYSLLAGFVEAGETAEQTVEREVYEEAKIKLENIRYYGSQSWPFPHSLMLAYIADYKSGDIVVDYNELEDARWFDIKSLRTCPDLLPATGSLSRMLINELILNKQNF